MKHDQLKTDHFVEPNKKGVPSVLPAVPCSLGLFTVPGGKVAHLVEVDWSGHAADKAAICGTPAYLSKWVPRFIEQDGMRLQTGMMETAWKDARAWIPYGDEPICKRCQKRQSSI